VASLSDLPKLTIHTLFLGHRWKSSSIHLLLASTVGQGRLAGREEEGLLYHHVLTNHATPAGRHTPRIFSS